MSGRLFSRVLGLILMGVAAAMTWGLLGGSSRADALAGCDGTIAIGEVIQCTISTSGGNQTLTFPGVAGAPMRVRVVYVSGTINPVVEVRRPNSSVLCAANFADESTCTLDTNGTHSLVLRDGSNVNTGTVNVTIQSLSAPVGCAGLAFGEAGSAGTITNAVEYDCYQRAGTVGQRWRIRAVETSGAMTASVELFRPDGTVLCNMSTNTDFTCLLDVTGTHTVLLRDSSGTQTGTYRVSLQKFPTPTGCASLGVGATTVADVSLAGASECLTFNGSSGNQMRVRAVFGSGTINPIAEVLRPDGTTICAVNFADELTCPLDTNGSHTLLIRDGGGVGAGTGTVNITMQRLDDPVGCASLSYSEIGQTGIITNPVEYDCFERSGNLGQRWRVRAVETAGAMTASVEVIRPDGTVLCNMSTNTDFTCLLDATGTHTVLLRDSSGTQTGDYRVSLNKFPGPTGCAALAFAGTAVADVSLAGAYECFTLDGSGAPPVRFRAVYATGTINPIGEVLRPDGTTICAVTFADEFTCDLDVPGTHTLLIRDGGGVGAGTGTVNVTMQRLDLPVGCTNLPFGEAGATGAIVNPVEYDCFQRSGKIGNRWRIRAVETAGAMTASVEVMRPDGTVLCNMSTNTDFTCLLDAAGTHTILLRDSSGTQTGNYRVSLQKFPKPAGCTAMLYGEVHVADVSLAGASECFTFNGSGAPPVRFRAVYVTGTINPIGEVLRADGSTICAVTFADEFTCDLDSTGTHTLLIRDGGGVGAGTGTVDITFNRLDVPTGCSPVSLGETGATGAIVNPVEYDCYQQTGSTGQRWRVRAVETAGAMTASVEVMRPDGSVLCNMSTNTDFTCLLDANGTHTILLRDSSGTQTGNYRVSLNKFPNPSGCATLAYGDTPTANVAQAGAYECFTFNGAGSPPIRFRAVFASGTINPIAEVLRPDGTTICAVTFADEFTCDLDVTGTHTLLIRDGGGVGAGTGTTSVTMQRLDGPVGCASVPFGETGTTGAITIPIEYDCFQQTGSTGQQWRVRAVETAGTMTTSVEMIRPDGSVLCNMSTNTDFTCLLDANGTHTILLRDSSGTLTGNYRVSLQKWPNPTGCATPVVGGPVVNDGVTDAGAMPCFTFAGLSTDDIRMRVVFSSGTINPIAEVLRPDGTTVCAVTFADEFVCALDVNGTHTVIVRDGGGVGAGTGNFTLELDEI